MIYSYMFQFKKPCKVTELIKICTVIQIFFCGLKEVQFSKYFKNINTNRRTMKKVCSIPTMKLLTKCCFNAVQSLFYPFKSKLITGFSMNYKRKKLQIIQKINNSSAETPWKGLFKQMFNMCIHLERNC